MRLRNDSLKGDKLETWRSVQQVIRLEIVSSVRIRLRGRIVAGFFSISEALKWTHS